MDIFLAILQFATLALILALLYRPLGDYMSRIYTSKKDLVDLAAKSVTSATSDSNERIRLTPTEWQVLAILIRNSGKLVTRQTLLTEIWGSEHVTVTGYLRLYVSQLRKKLERDPSNPQHILTESGMGYRFQPDAEPPAQ